MKLTEINDWLSLIANLGVLVGLFVLIIEISQNTRAIDNEASWARVSTANDTYSMLVENDEIVSILLKYRDDPNWVNAPSSPEILRYRFLQEMISRQNEARFLTKSDGDDVTRASLMRYLANPGGLEFYKSELPVFSREYAAFVSAAIQEVEGN